MLALNAFVRPGLVCELRGRTRDEVLQELVDLCVQQKALQEPKRFLEKLLEREREGGTAIGLGVAIPHARLEELPEILVAVGLSREGLDFGGPDGAPVHLVFLIGINQNQARYLQLLARISWLVRNQELRKSFMQAKDAGDLYQRLKAH